MTSYFFSDCDMIITSNIDKIDITYQEITRDRACNLLILMDTYFSWLFWNDTDLVR